MQVSLTMKYNTVVDADEPSVKLATVGAMIMDSSSLKTSAEESSVLITSEYDMLQNWTIYDSR